MIQHDDTLSQFKVRVANLKPWPWRNRQPLLLQNMVWIFPIRYVNVYQRVFIESFLCYVFALILFSFGISISNNHTRILHAYFGGDSHIVLARSPVVWLKLMDVLCVVTMTDIWFMSVISILVLNSINKVFSIVCGLSMFFVCFL